jgi:hypothetical protein
VSIVSVLVEEIARLRRRNQYLMEHNRRLRKQAKRWRQEALELRPRETVAAKDAFRRRQREKAA